MQKNFWIRDTISCIPQIWYCVLCEWSGDNPTIYIRNSFHNNEHYLEPVQRDPIPHPTCPNCGEHRFYIEDIKNEDDDS